MITLDTTRTQPHTSSIDSPDTRTANTELRDRWRALAGLTQPQVRRTGAEIRDSETDLTFCHVTVASPARITARSWGLSGPIA